MSGITWSQQLPIFTRSTVRDTKYAFIRPTYALPICCICESKLRACNLASTNTSKMHSRDFERKFS